MYAQKCFKIHNDTFNEIKILDCLEHPSIIKLVDQEKTESHYCLLFEYAQHGELFDYLLKNKARFKDENHAKYIFFQLVSALKYMKDHGYVHRDLKPENILIHSFSAGRPNIKLIDFGFACLEKETEFLPSAGTLPYLSPECFFIKLRRRSYASDVWALGLILYQLMEVFLPVMITQEDVKNSGLKNKLVTISHAASKMKNWSPECRNLYSEMMEIEPEKRLTYEQIINHSWLKK